MVEFNFHVFNVEHGQAAAARLPNGQWCVFDVGSSAGFSPIERIIRLEAEHRRSGPPLLRNLKPRIAKATISHLHADHLSDYARLLAFKPAAVRTVHPDKKYLEDASESSAPESVQTLERFLKETTLLRYCPARESRPATIRELGLPVWEARAIGGTANGRVNSASIITRINCYENSILICGDMETEGWEWALSRPNHRFAWAKLVSSVDVLVAPHHGHASGFSTQLMKLARPGVVVISVASGDESVDPRYSGDLVRGIVINGKPYKSLTTRQMGHIGLTITPPATREGKGQRIWSFQSG